MFSEFSERDWQKALKDAEIEDFRFHDLRHTCASDLAMYANASPFEIQAQLGHRTLAMAARYAHLAPGASDDALKRAMAARFRE